MMLIFFSSSFPGLYLSFYLYLAIYLLNCHFFYWRALMFPASRPLLHQQRFQRHRQIPSSFFYRCRIRSFLFSSSSCHLPRWWSFFLFFPSYPFFYLCLSPCCHLSLSYPFSSLFFCFYVSSFYHLLQHSCRSFLLPSFVY